MLSNNAQPGNRQFKTALQFVFGILIVALPVSVFAESNVDVRGRIQFDGRYQVHTAENNVHQIHSESDLDLRGLRVQFEGGASKITKFKFSADFTDNETDIKDLYLDTRLGESNKIRMGQFHVPFGNESLGSSRFALFQEKSTISDALSASRDRGVMFHGPILGKHTFFQLAYLNGSGSNIGDNNDEKDWALRFVFRPAFLESDDVNMWLGFSYTTGTELSTGDDDVKLDTESNSGLKYFKAEFPEDVSYDRNRYDIEYTFLNGGFMIKGEIIRTEFFSSEGYVQGGYIATSYILNGEKHRIKHGLLYRQISREIPGKDKGNPSAVGLAIRYSWFKVSDAFFENDSLYNGWVAVDSSTYYKAGSAVTVGLNWYINRETRFITNWILSFAEVPDAMDPSKTTLKQVEASIIVRLQIEF